MAGLRFLLFPVLLLDALPAEFLLLLLFVAGLAGSAVNLKHKSSIMQIESTLHLISVEKSYENRVNLFRNGWLDRLIARCEYTVSLL